MAARRPARPRDASGASPGAGTSGAPRRMPVRMTTVRAGVSSFAALCGLACYVLLAQIHVNLLLAGVLGFAFALLVRLAAASLVRDWLASHTTRAGGGRDSPAAPREGAGRGTPRR